MKAVISGASRGIGKAIAIELASHDIDVAIYARSEKDLTELKAQINKLYPNVEVLTKVCDASDKKQVKAFAAFIEQEWKQVDILVNNAGTFIQGAAHQAEDGALEKLMAVNLYSAYYLTQYLVKGMMKKKAGHIFNICSIASLQAYPSGALYGITKYALLGFSKNLRTELMPYHIKVTSVMPGAVNTDSWASAGLPEKRLMPPEDIAKLIYAAYNTSEQTVVEDIIIRPLMGDIRGEEL